MKWKRMIVRHHCVTVWAVALCLLFHSATRMSDNTTKSDAYLIIITIIRMDRWIYNECVAIIVNHNGHNSIIIIMIHLACLTDNFNLWTYIAQCDDPLDYIQHIQLLLLPLAYWEAQFVSRFHFSYLLVPLFNVWTYVIGQSEWTKHVDIWLLLIITNHFVLMAVCDCFACVIALEKLWWR